MSCANTHKHRLKNALPFTDHRKTHCSTHTLELNVTFISLDVIFPPQRSFFRIKTGIKQKPNSFFPIGIKKSHQEKAIFPKCTLQGIHNREHTAGERTVFRVFIKPRPSSAGCKQSGIKQKSGSYLSLLHVEMTWSTFGMRLRESHFPQMEMWPYFIEMGSSTGSSNFLTRDLFGFSTWK